MPIELHPSNFSLIDKTVAAVPNPNHISRTEATGRATRYLESILSKLALGLVVNRRRLLGVGQLAASGLLALVVCTALNLSPLLESVRPVSFSIHIPPLLSGL